MQEDSKYAFEYNKLKELPLATAALFNSYERSDRSSCLPNTREQILDDIRSWADHGKKHLYWLQGFAGTGKTTIAQTVASNFSDRNRLAASFFFSRDIGGDASQARFFVTSIARQLAKVDSRLRKRISQAVEEDDTIVNQALNEQWRHLVFNPLKDVESNLSSRPSLIIVIDALDECEDAGKAQSIIHLLAQIRDIKCAGIKVFVTSRPTRPMERSFSEAESEEFVLHDISRDVVDEDIGVFYSDQFALIRSEYGIVAEWPDGATKEKLIMNAGGLFIWADTACRFVRRGGGRFIKTRLSKLVDSNLHNTDPEKKLDQLYLTVLDQALPFDCDEDELAELGRDLKRILGIIVSSLSSISILTVHKLTGISVSDVEESLTHLHSILDIRHNQSSQIKIHHPSFRDFLFDRQRCTDERFSFNTGDGYDDLANGCINIMSTELKRDLCDLRDPGILLEDIPQQRIEAHLSDGLIHACQYWVDYLMKVQSRTYSHGKAQYLVEKHFLHWLEALSLSKNLSQCHNSLRLLLIIFGEVC